VRILHTGDWHMNYRLNRVDMAPLLQDAIQQVESYLRAHDVDVLVIAGDLFSGRESRDQLRSSVRFLKDTFGPFLSDGGTIIAISGNHDSSAFFEMLRDTSDLVSPIRRDDDGIHAPGRLYLAPNPRVLTLRGRSGQRVQFVLMPYPRPRCYLYGQDTRFKSIDERNAAMAQMYRETMVTLLNEEVDRQLPAVLISHAQVRGVPVNDVFVKGEEHDVIVEVSDLPLHFAYGAYGHIHRQRPALPGKSQFWYCGSLLPLDAGEQGQQKAVLLVEIQPGSETTTPTPLPIDGPRLLDLTITPEELGTLRETHLDCGTALLRYRLRYDPAVYPDPFPLHQQVRDIFPFWYDAISEPTRSEEILAPAQASQSFSYRLEDIPGTVLGYLSQITPWPDCDAAATDVLALANSLLSDDDLLSSIEETG
jgi:DNA repair protein SbcD/Mre11